MTGGRSSSSIVRIAYGIARQTIEIEPRWRKALTRKRATPVDRVGEVDLVLLARTRASLPGRR